MLLLDALAKCDLQVREHFARSKHLQVISNVIPVVTPCQTLPTYERTKWYSDAQSAALHAREGRAMHEAHIT